MNKQLKSLIYAAVLVGWFFSTQYIMVYAFAMIAGNAFTMEHSFLITLSSYILNLGVIFGLDKWKNYNSLEVYKGFDYKHFYRYIGYGIGLWFLSTIINAIFLPFFPEYGAEVGGLFNNEEHLSRFMALVIGAPLVEEYIFRGRIQGAFKKVFGKNLAIIMQGVVFGIIHPFGLQKIYASVLGIGLGYIREKSGNILTSTIMHMTINGIGWIIGMIGTYFITM